MATKATLINPEGNKVVVESGSQDAQKYFGQGYTLMGATPSGSPAPAGGPPPLTTPPTPPVTPPTPPGYSGPSNVAPPPVQAGGTSPYGNNQAFGTALSAIMGKATQMKSVQDQKSALLTHLYDRHLSEDEIAGLSPAQQEAIRSGDRNLIEYQIATSNDVLRGRQDQNLQALNYLMQGYKEDATNYQKALDDANTRRDAATAQIMDWASKGISLAGLDPAIVSRIESGNMTPDDALKLSSLIKGQVQSSDLKSQVIDGQTVMVDKQGNIVKNLSTDLAKQTEAGQISFGGKTYDFANYATDPEHENKVMAILDSMPTFDSLNSLDKYIQAKAPGSPITQKMVMDASHQYGVPAELIMAIMQEESGFGTKGAAAKTFNPGNVGNVDSGATTNMGKWESGVAAVAKQIAKRDMGDTSAAGSAPLTNPDDELIAQQASHGQLTFDQFNKELSSRAGSSQEMKKKIMARASAIAASEGRTFDPAQMASQYKFASTPQVQQAIVQIDTVLPNIDEIISLSDAFKRKDYPAVNRGLRAIGYNMGKKDVTNLQELQNIISDELGKALAGNATLSDAKLNQAKEAVDINQSPEQFISSMNILKVALDNRKKAIWKQAGVYSQLLGDTGEVMDEGTDSSGSADDILKKYGVE